MLRHLERALLILVLLLALGLRLYGLGFSLPYTVHPDEPNVVDRAVATIQTGDWNPGWFIYPSGYHYLQVGVQTLHLVWGVARGEYTSPADLPASSHVITTAPGTYLWARGTTALLGLLTVFLVYLLGRRFAGPAAGLAAALLLALSPLHAENSHYVATDVPTAALVTLALYLALEVLDRGGGGRAFLAGLVAGLAAGFKYNGVVALLPVLLAAALWATSPTREAAAWWRRLWPLLALGLLGAVVGYLAACPYTLVELPTFLDDLGYETHIYRFGGEAGIIRTYPWNGRLLPPWQAYAHALWWENPWAALSYLGGIVLVLARRRRGEVVLLSFVAAYYLFLTSYASIFVRNVLPALPGLAVCGGLFLEAAVRWLAGRPLWRGRLLRWSAPLLAVLLVAITAGPAGSILADNAYRAIPTSQVQARDWLDAHVVPGERVAAELHPALFVRTPYAVTAVDFVSNYPLEAFVNQGYRYIVVNSEHYGPEFAEDDTFPDHYLSLLEQMEPVADFPGHARRLPGPRLTIFRLPAGDLRPQHALTAAAGPVLRLHGFDLGQRAGRDEMTHVRPRDDLRAGEVLALTLYLHIDAPASEDYVLVVRLRNAAGRVVASLEQPVCGPRCPLTTWAPGQTVAVNADMPLAPVLPAGTYRLEAHFLRPGTGEALPIEPAGPEPGLLFLAEIVLLERSP